MTNTQKLIERLEKILPGLENSNSAAEVAMVEALPEVIAELTRLKAERDALAEALKKLANEASALRPFEYEVRQAISNTNWECLQLRVTEARAALEPKP
jgi:uncharacterized coiled-coil DUF342 family protein